MQIELKARLTTDAAGRPLVVLREMPGCDAEIYPAQLRQLARQLNAVANAADQGERGNVHYQV